MEDQSLASQIGDERKMADRFLPGRPPPVPPSRPVSPVSSSTLSRRTTPKPTPHPPRHIPRKPLSKASATSTLHSAASEKKSLLQLDDDTIYSSGHDDDKGTPWRPFYLRRRTLLCFGAIFLSIAVVMQALLAVSVRRQGLADADGHLSAVYRFGPPAVFIIVSAFWARVEYQAQVYTPWIALSNGPLPASDTLLLDYLADLSPVAIFRSLRRKHFLVAAACSIGLALKLLIALSAALLSPESRVVARDGVGLALLDEFNIAADSAPARPFTEGEKFGQAMNMAHGITHLNVSYPWGSAPGHAFQRFTAEGERFDSSAASAMREVQAVVEGLVIEVSCTPVLLTRKDIRRLEDDEDPGVLHFVQHEFTILIEIDDDESCRLTCLRYDQSPAFQEGNNFKMVVADLASEFSRCEFETDECKETYTGDGRHAALIGNAPLDLLPREPFDNMTMVERNTTEGVLCTPSTWRTNLSVARSRDSYEIAPPNLDANRADIDLIPIWGINFNTSGELRSPSDLGCLEWPRPKRDDETQEGYHITSEALAQTIEGFSEIFLPLFVHFYLFKPTRTKTEGSMTVEISRLVLNDVISHIATGVLMTAVVFIVLLVCTGTAPRRSFMPREATTVASYAVLLRDSTSFLARLRGTADQPVSVLRETLRGGYLSSIVKYGRETSRFEIINDDDDDKDDESESEPRPKLHQPVAKSKPDTPYSPWLTRPGYRIACLLILAGLIAAVRVVQLQSTANNGLLDIPEQQGTPYIYYTWSVVPSLIAVLLSNYLLARDLVVRAHAPLARLMKGGRSAVGVLQVAYVDNVGHRTLFNSLRRRDWVVLISFLIPFPAAFLTAFTSTLFDLDDVQRVRDIPLQQSMWLREGATWSTPDLTMGTMIYHNASFPAWTYDGFVFPNMALAADASPPTSAEGPDAYLVANVTATTSEVECDQFVVERMVVNRTTNNYRENVTTFLPFGLGKGCEIEFATPESTLVGYYDDFLFGAYPHKDCENYSSAAAWGKVGPKGDFEHMTGLWCRETLHEVVATTHFLLPDWTIDPERPPVIVERVGSRVLTTGDDRLGTPVTFGSAPMPDKNSLDAFFQALTQGRWAVPVEFLADPDRVDDVEKALVDLRIMWRASAINGAVDRVPFGNASEPLEPERPAAISGVAVGFKRRLVSRPWPAWFLTGILSLILALDLVAFFITPRNTLPKSPNSIAAMASYLADDILARAERGAGDRTGTGWASAGS